MARVDDFPDATTAPGGGTPSAFIMHHTAGRGDPASVVKYWQQQGKGYGAQYIMDRQGVVHDVAKEFGYNGTNEILNGTGVGKGLSNSNVVGMEIVANDDKDVTPAQAQTAAQFIQARYPNLPVYGHGQVNAGHKEATEGMTAVNAVNALRNPPPAGSTTINAANAPVAGALAANQETGPESVGASPATAAQPGQPMDVRQLVFNKLTGAGLQPHQALGAIWGLNGESRGLNPNAYNPNDPGGSVGFGQWLGPRRAALEAFAKDRGTAVTDPNTQADFMVDELTNKNAPTYQPGAFAKMQGASSAEDATKIWTSQFERPFKDNSDQRIKAGPQAASLDANGNFVLGPGVGANAPSTTAAPAVASAAPAAAPLTRPPTDQSWWGKLTGTPTDAQGNPTGEKSPLQQMTQMATSRLSAEGQTAKEEAPQGGSPAAEQYSNQRFAPGARNTSPMGGMLLPSVPQTYGQTLNSFEAPLTWNSAPPGAPKTAPAGQQPTPGAQMPGISLTSLGALPGLGLGSVDPNLGYGFG